MSWAAVIWRSYVISWPGVFAALGALCAVLGCLALWLARGRPPRELALFFPGAVLFSLVLGRLFHWYSHPLLYAGFLPAMTDYLQGGFSLSGAFAGTLLSAVLVRASGRLSDLPGLLDALAPAGALGIAVGRLGSLFDLSDRGRFLVRAPALQRLPFAALTSLDGGAGEWRFATFCAQALAAGALAAGLTWMYLRLSRETRKPGAGAEGRVFALFLALYGASQVVLDSTRYDADFFRANGFIHVPQVLAAAALLGALAWLSVRSVRVNGLRWWHALCWCGAALCIGLGGGMEYFVQRRADQFALAYGVMGGCLAVAAAIAVVLCASLRGGERAVPEEKKEKSRADVDKWLSND